MESTDPPDGAAPRPLGPVPWAEGARDRRLFLAVLLVQAAIFWGLTWFGHPFGTAGMECAVAAFTETALREPAWAILDAAPGAVGGGVVSSVLTWPFAWTGTAPLALHLAAWLFALAVPVAIRAWALPLVGPTTATMAAASAAVPMPIVLHAQLVTGNWHWTQLAFDWGALALAGALHQGAGSGAALALGVTASVGIYNSPASLPFVGLAVLWAAVGPSRGWLRRAVAFVAGAAPGLLWWGVAIRHRPLGASTDTARHDPILKRLLSFRFDPDRLPGLIDPDLPWALHLYDTHPQWPLPLAYGASRVAVTVLWLGLALGVARALWRALVAREIRRGVALSLPAMFALTYVAAYSLVATRIELRGLGWSEWREESHRGLAPLLVALGVAAVCGWGTLRSRGPRWVRALAWTATILPTALSLGGALALFATLPRGASPALGFGSDAACFDTLAIFAIQRGAAVEQVEERCRALSTPQRQRDCLAGLRMGQGFERASIGPEPGAAGPTPPGSPCDRLPPDYRGRCTPWAEGTAPTLGAEVVSTCGPLSGQDRALCYLGAGWFVTQLGWGRRDWPLLACDSLVDSDDAFACWMGQGFQLGDHMMAVSWKVPPLLDRAQPSARAALAAGIGFALERGRMLPAGGAAMCQSLPPADATACERGRTQARRWLALDPP